MNKLTDLKSTKKPGKGEPTSAGENGYPYGTRISLDEDSLQKLGMDMPKVGQKIHMRAHGVVHSASQSESAGGKKRRNVELQLHKVSIEKRGGEPGSMTDAVRNGVDEADDD